LEEKNTDQESKEDYGQIKIDKKNNKLVWPILPFKRIGFLIKFKRLLLAMRPIDPKKL